MCKRTFSSENSCPFYPSVTLHINTVSLSLSLFTCTNFSHPHFLCIFSSSSSLCSSSSSYRSSHLSSHSYQPTQKWPAHMKQTQLPRNLPHPRNLSPNLENLGISTLGNLGNLMNIMKIAMNFLGRHKEWMNKSRNSLDILGEWKNSQRWLGMRKHSKPRGKGRRRFSSYRSLLPKDRGLKRMTLQFTEMGLWRLLPLSLRQSSPTSTTACSSTWLRLMI